MQPCTECSIRWRSNDPDSDTKWIALFQLCCDISSSSCVVSCISVHSSVSTLIKKNIKFSSYIRKFRVEQLQSHIWLTASSYMEKYLRISSYIRKPIYDFATAPLWISLHMKKKLFSFLSVYPVFAYISLCLDLSSPVSLFPCISLSRYLTFSVSSLSWSSIDLFGLPGIIALLPTSQSVHYAIASVEERS